MNTPLITPAAVRYALLLSFTRRDDVYRYVRATLPILLFIREMSPEMRDVHDIRHTPRYYFATHRCYATLLLRMWRGSALRGGVNILMLAGVVVY